ncbi:NADH-quinone oxidoreductase subunit NuoN [Liberibacter crescens]|nr:NADH-quinone oxidoreductase subunit NuoN [Liberibacter crescens]AMC13312.1 NADH:ubiquinone oxidoreductase subunit N [Liberibacter crescens]
MASDNIIGDLSLCVPELILAIGSLVILMLGVFFKKKSYFVIPFFAISVLFIAFIYLSIFSTEGIGFGGVYILDSWALFVKCIVLLSSILIFIMILAECRIHSFISFEFSVLLLLAILGNLLLISANDMIALYMALELQSLALYVIVAINRDDLRSSEAGLKYFVLGALSSGILLYGMSFVYGFTQHTGFVDIATTLSNENYSFGLALGFVLILVGIAFKISAVPFHMWTPDVYEGAPTSVTAFLATVSKISAIVVLTRIVVSVFGVLSFSSIQAIIFVSLASMFLGSFSAIGQKNIKRLMAYSSITHIGYALLGLISGTDAGVVSMLHYMIIYLIMVLGVFACIIALRFKEGGAVESISDLAGLSQDNPFIAFILTVLMFSLAGIPPFAGFFGKYFVFLSIIEEHFYTLAILGILSSVIGVYYYLRVIKVIWFDKSEKQFCPISPELKFVFSISGLFVVMYIFIASFLNSKINLAAASLF